MELEVKFLCTFPWYLVEKTLCVRLGDVFVGGGIHNDSVQDRESHSWRFGDCLVQDAREGDVRLGSRAWWSSVTTGQVLR